MVWINVEEGGGGGEASEGVRRSKKKKKKEEGEEAMAVVLGQRRLCQGRKLYMAPLLYMLDFVLH